MKLHVGTSGFSYSDWRNGVFYPKGLAPNKWLAYYAGIFSTVELNVTFYRPPSLETFQSWHDKTPPDFRFSIKGSRTITHFQKLHNVSESLRTFFENAKPLAEKLSVVLWQLPSSFRVDAVLLKNFLADLRPYQHARHAFEFRHLSWIETGIVKMLRDENIAICMADWPGFTPEIPTTADFVYVRRHGTDKQNRYHGAYSPQALNVEAAQIRAWSKQDKDIFLYFNNDYEGHAAQNALTIQKLFSVRKHEPTPVFPPVVW